MDKETTIKFNVFNQNKNFLFSFNKHKLITVGDKFEYSTKSYVVTGLSNYISSDGIICELFVK